MATRPAPLTISLEARRRWDITLGTLLIGNTATLKPADHAWLVEIGAAAVQHALHCTQRPARKRKSARPGP